MKFIGFLFAFTFLFACTSFAAGPNKPGKLELRELYWASVEDQDKTEEMLDLIESSTTSDPLVLAYRGAAESLMAKHVFFPVKKLDWLKKCDETFKEAVKLDPKNIEIRFLRFAYQHYIPAFLGYSNEVEDDRLVLVKELKDQEGEWFDDRELYNNVIEFLLETERCTEEEEIVLMTLKNNE